MLRLHRLQSSNPLSRKKSRAVNSPASSAHAAAAAAAALLACPGSLGSPLAVGPVALWHATSASMQQQHTLRIVVALLPPRHLWHHDAVVTQQQGCDVASHIVSGSGTIQRHLECTRVLRANAMMTHLPAAAAAPAAPGAAAWRHQRHWHRLHAFQTSARHRTRVSFPDAGRVQLARPTPDLAQQPCMVHAHRMPCTRRWTDHQSARTDAEPVGSRSSPLC
jgi:hypothetical protein